MFLNWLLQSLLKDSAQSRADFGSVSVKLRKASEDADLLDYRIASSRSRCEVLCLHWLLFCLISNQGRCTSAASASASSE